MFVFSALILFVIVIAVNLAAAALLFPIAAAAIIIASVNLIGIKCDMGFAPISWNIATAITGFISSGLVGKNMLFDQAVACDFYRLIIYYLLCSVALVIWWMIRESRRSCRQ